MIEKNIRLQPHHSRDLLVGQRSDGKRPKYQPPGGGATSLGSGRDVGGGGGASHDRGGGQHAAQAAAASRAAASRAAASRAAEQQAAAKRDMQATIAQAEKAEANRVSQLGREGKIDVGFQEVLRKQKIQQDLDNLEDLDDRSDFIGFNTAPIVDIKDIKGEVTDPDSGSYDKLTEVLDSPDVDEGFKRYVRQVQQPIAPTPKSGVLGTIGKIALTGLTAGAGAGLFGKDIAGLAKAAKWVGRGKDIKTALDTGKLNILGKEFNVPSNLRSTIKKAADLRSRPKDMPEHLGERGFRTRDDTPPRDGEGGDIQTTITGDKGLLTEGAETLGITDEQREQYLLMQNKMKTALDQGSYINAQGQVIQLNEQQLDQLQKYIDNLNKILGNVLQTAAHGGRIDSPLMGGSRYI